MASTTLLLSATTASSRDLHGADALDPNELKRLAVLGDRGGLDLLVLDQPADGLIAATWLVPATKRLGLVATIPATYAQPFHVARSISAMDILSGGRIGWLPVSAGHIETVAAYGNVAVLTLPTALDKAVEFVAAAQALWDSWDGDALIIDKAAAHYLDHTKIRRVDFRGEHFQVMGPLNAARPVQGHPVLMQVATDPLFERLADKAELAIVSAADWTGATQQIQALKKRGVARVIVQVTCAIDPTEPADLAVGKPSIEVSGNAEEIVRSLAEAHEMTGADGFHFVSATGAKGLEPLLQQLLPEFRRRRLLAESGPVDTLRQRLGLAIPVNPYAAQRGVRG